MPEGAACKTACAECATACDTVVAADAAPGSTEAIACIAACEGCAVACEDYMATGKAPPECEPCMAACQKCITALSGDTEEEDDMAEIALREENAQLKKRLAELESAQTAAGKADRAALAEVARLRGDVGTLKARADAAEAAATHEKLERELDGYEARGLFAPIRREYYGKLAQVSRALFDDAIAHAEQHPAVPLGERGHATTPPKRTPAEDLDARIRAHAATLGVNLAAQPQRYGEIHKALLAGGTPTAGTRH